MFIKFLRLSRKSTEALLILIMDILVNVNHRRIVTAIINRNPNIKVRIRNGVKDKDGIL